MKASPKKRVARRSTTSTAKKTATKKAPLAKRRAVRKTASKTLKTAKLGSGKRFKAVEAEAKASGARNPAAVAAAAGRRKYGEAEMAKLSRAGRK